mgnify:CR=1 FL=1
MTERDELREKIGDILDEHECAMIDWCHAQSFRGRPDTNDVADRILALLPPQPKLEWRDNKLFVGHLCLGKIKYNSYVSEWGLYGHLGISLGWRGTEAEARTAVERAVKEALGLPK